LLTANAKYISLYDAAHFQLVRCPPLVILAEENIAAREKPNFVCSLEYESDLKNGATKSPYSIEYCGKLFCRTERL